MYPALDYLVQSSSPDYRRYFARSRDTRDCDGTARLRSNNRNALCLYVNVDTIVAPYDNDTGTGWKLISSVRQAMASTAFY